MWALLLTFVFVACVRELFRTRRAVWGGIVFGLLVAAAVMEDSVAPELGVRHGKYLPAAALAAWVIATCTTTNMRHFGLEAACGVVSGAYVLAGFSKLRHSGLAWIDGEGVGTLLAERQLSAGFSFVRDFLIARPNLCEAGAAITLTTELAAGAFMVKSARLPIACALAVMHIGIGLTMGYWYPEWIALDLGLACMSRVE